MTAINDYAQKGKSNKFLKVRSSFFQLISRLYAGDQAALFHQAHLWLSHFSS